MSIFAKKVHRGWIVSLVVVAAALYCAPGRAQWPQWGGPDRDFSVDGGKLADAWPEEGPKRIWQRELGEGYSSIVTADGVLFTMYRVGENEFTIALDARTGETVWEHRNPSPFTKAMTEFGPGPHATPLISGDRVFTIGSNAVLHGFDKNSGDVLWKHDLLEEYGGHVFEYGYACSPLAHGGMVIVPVDRRRASGHAHGPRHSHAGQPATPEARGQSLMAFHETNGAVAWRSQDFLIDYSSPILINLAGEAHLVLFMNQGIMGVDPADGQLRWHHPIPSNHGGNYATPLWLGEDRIFCSSSHTSSRMIRLAREDGRTVPEELWYSTKLRISHGNAVRFGDYVLGSSGRGQGAAFLVALNIHTGERAWIERGYDTATFVKAGEKMIMLTEDGQLALMTATENGLIVHSKCQVTERLSWTAPTLVGTTLYVRDREHIMALDLG